VLVTINYRLGVFGFLATADLAKEANGSAGNYGMMDMVAALRWVNKNIKNFGGETCAAGQRESLLDALTTSCNTAFAKLGLTLGATALNFLLGVEEKITRERGKWRERDGVPVLPTYHPAFILRDAARETEVFGDFDAIASRLRLPSAK